MTDCHVCRRHHPTDDGDCTRACRHRPATIGHLCDGCHLRILRDLTTIETAWELSADGAVVTGRGGRGSNERSLPGGTVHLNYREASELIGCLRGWAAVWHEDNPDLTFPTAAHRDEFVPVLVQWLRSHLHHYGSQHEAVADFAEELRDWAKESARMAGMIADGTPVPCPGLAAPCGRILRVNPNDWDEKVRCKGCSTEWTTGRLLQNADTENLWLCAEDILHMYGIPERTVRHWGKTEKVRRKGNLYHVGDVQTVRRTPTAAAG
jgi:hypothetical protein